MSAAKTTTDHKEIRKWVEAHGGRPAHVKQTGRSTDPGILRVDFPGFTGEDTLERISWSEWFDAFDKKQLAFIYQDSPRSRFNKLVARESASATTRRAGAAKRTAAKRSTRKRTAAKRPSAKRTTVKRTTVKRTTAKRPTGKRPTARRGKEEVVDGAQVVGAQVVRCGLITQMRIPSRCGA